MIDRKGEVWCYFFGGKVPVLNGTSGDHLQVGHMQCIQCSYSIKDQTCVNQSFAGLVFGVSAGWTGLCFGVREFWIPDMSGQPRQEGHDQGARIIGLQMFTTEQLEETPVYLPVLCSQWFPIEGTSEHLKPILGSHMSMVSRVQKLTSSRFIRLAVGGELQDVSLYTWIFKRHKFLPEAFFSEKTP